MGCILFKMAQNSLPPVKENERIIFDAVVARVQTLVDGGLRVTLDLPEQAIAQAAALMECKRQEVYLKVEVYYGQ